MKVNKILSLIMWTCLFMILIYVLFFIVKIVFYIAIFVVASALAYFTVKYYRGKKYE